MESHRDVCLTGMDTTRDASADAIFSAGAATTATAGVAAAAAASTAGAVTTTAAAAVSASEAQIQSNSSTFDAAAPPEVGHPKLTAQVAWDAHLDNPTNVNPVVAKMMQTARRATLGLTSDVVEEFCNGVTFVSLGCFCAASNALNLLGLKRHSYPFDWVRSSLEGIMHCLDMEFEDFLTYSTYNIHGEYAVFGGTRWGGSFWHHNLEARLTSQDMSRRVERFYGRGEVEPGQPRFFVRVVNSTRELLAAARLRDALQQALPEAEVYVLLIVDLQSEMSLRQVSGKIGQGILVCTVSESISMSNMSQSRQSFMLCSETYAQAIAAGIRHWCGETTSERVQTFSTWKQLGASCEQFDGGDPTRELFVPRKFYGQRLNAMDHQSPMERLFSKSQVQMFMVPKLNDFSKPFVLECFGRTLSVTLPAGAACGQALHLSNNSGTLGGHVTYMFNGQTVQVGQALVEEVPMETEAPAPAPAQQQQQQQAPTTLNQQQQEEELQPEPERQQLQLPAQDQEEGAQEEGDDEEVASVAEAEVDNGYLSDTATASDADFYDLAARWKLCSSSESPPPPQAP